jgi:histidinol-phosphate phosphatase family protein
MAPRAAVFLDRDRTIVEDPGFLHESGRVVLLPGAALGLAALARAGWPLIIVSNQAGIARGLYRPDAFAAVNTRLETLLAAHRVRFLAAYYCPHHPDFTGPCECRKPGVALFRLAALEHDLDLAASWYLGDRWRDVEPALTLGGRGLLVNPDGASEDARLASAAGVPRVTDLVQAAAHIGAA